MPSVQDVRMMMTADGKSHFSFGIWDDQNRLVVNIGFASHKEAEAALQQIKDIISRPSAVVGAN
jgi:hypothetical protein